MPKKIPQDIVKQLRELGEEIVKEGARQPIEMVKIAGEQTGFMPRNWGEKPKTGDVGEVVQKKKEKELEEEAERKKKLAHWRRRQKELEAKPVSPEGEVIKEKIEEREEQEKLVAEAERKKPLEEPPAKKPRLFLGIKRRQEKAQPERRAARKISG